jgi:mannose-6-phosphate isomerase-like protein (cupin superfamily)
MLSKINLKDKLSQFHDHWNPRIIGELNQQHVKLAKLSGEFIWHKHDEEDEMFMVLSGTLKIELRDQLIVLDPGECLIIPKGTEHRPVAETEVAVLLFEPASTLNTGDQRSELTRDQLESL